MHLDESSALTCRFCRARLIVPEVHRRELLSKTRLSPSVRLA